MPPRTSTPWYLRFGPFFNVLVRREDVLRGLDALKTPLAIVGSLRHVLSNEKAQVTLECLGKRRHHGVALYSALGAVRNLILARSSRIY